MWRILGQHDLGRGVKGNRSARSRGWQWGRAAPLRALSPKPVTPSGHEKTPGRSSLSGSLPHTHAALLKTARVVRCPRVRSGHSPGGPGGREDHVTWRPGWVLGSRTQGTRGANR